MGQWQVVVAASCAAVFAMGCVEKADPAPAVDKQAIARWVSSEPTKPEHRVDAQLGDKVTLLGYDLHPEHPKKGQAFSVVWHWQVLKPLDSGWRLFTHVADGSGKNRLNEDGNGPIRRAYQPGHWEAGEYIRDRQRIELDDSWQGNQATVFVGIWRGNERLAVKQGPKDDENRVRAAEIELKAAEPEKPEALPSLVAQRTDQAPTLDGVLDEPMWKKAAVSDALVNTMTGRPQKPQAKVRAAWDDTRLYLAFEVADDFLKSEFDEHDDHLWEQDCVEVMVDPDGDGKNYFELQVSPRGVVFDTRYDSRRKPGPFGHTDWDTQLENGVALRGEIGDDAQDEGYTVEMAIPFEAFAAGEPSAKKPDAGDAWRVNFYVLDAREKGQRGVGWSPPKVGDFHRPDRFGTLKFQ